MSRFIVPTWCYMTIKPPNSERERRRRRRSMGFQADPAFIQDIEHRPKSTFIEAGGIPLIDISPLLETPISDDGSNIPSSLLAEVEAACRVWGFFQVINHGVPSHLLNRIHSAARQFFALPTEEKRQVRRDDINPLGYYDTEHTKNVRDWKEVFDFVTQEVPASNENELTFRNQWPEYPPDLRAICEEYASGVEGLAFKLLEVIAATLGLPAKRLNGYFQEQSSFLRLNHYPTCPFPELALGVGRHKDAGALTVLWQGEVGGLEVKRRSDGEWVRVKPIPNSFIINVGDIIQVWSNDKYESADHRVAVNSQKDRFSIPFFFNPGQHTIVEPFEELVTEERPAQYKPYNWGEFFRARKDSNFKKLAAENLQIYHFRK